ncbi:cell division protein FtsI/penicillin-binding protein 2 [Longilinea arvoryzae]|uniref:Cell division protein FtsI/penicillin-binding protein 2 n=1 Tax=Longilinea arvoryzae TaxID=360412 RepID=A0A0S7B590_9CHLR|nr:penicillin-binding transpeptidase domain-containing protein [Longilinea arvoryzae]GAP12300.1 cell division protein FtsI/penicillin-binding protein 2 [Longilinea arvoryzae]
MKNLRAFSILILMSILAGCAGGATNLPGGSSNLPTPQVNVTQAPEVGPTAEAFMKAWQSFDYPTMYASLSRLSQDAITGDDFAKRYTDAAETLSLKSLDYTLSSTLVRPDSAQASFKLTYHTALVGDLQADVVMNLSLEENAWKINWEDALIHPLLKGGNKLQMRVEVPSRGTIYDRNDNALAVQSDAYAIGIVPGQFNSGMESRAVALLSRLTGQPAAWIEAMYKDESPDYYIPIGEASAQDVDDASDQIATIGGIYTTKYSTRYYPSGGIGPHVVGYTSFIYPEELTAKRQNGYLGDEKIGRAGLEEWGEQYLIGTRAASLYIVDANGTPVTRLAEVSAQPAYNIYSTIDSNLQDLTQKAMEGFTGAAVVLERDTGRVLALVSTPEFDPNLFDPNNNNSQYLLKQVYDTTENRLYNRATMSGYPLGSVFKIIVMAAGLESGLFTANDTYECGYEFNETGRTYTDWTLEHDQPPSGLLTLPEGLMRSCNIWFYHLSLDLYRNNLPTAVSDMARSFGLGKATGIGQLSEVTGNVPDPESEDDAVQLGIGQSTLLVTPLQVAEFIAAVGNGGTLYRPQVVEKITSVDGDPVFEFKPEVKGTLPVKPENLATIQDAMRSVVTDKRGTAQWVMVGLQIPVYGKTGTAQNDGPTPHAWFAGYTDAGREDKPDIAVVVLCERAGEGSDYAAPIFRRIVEDYFYGKPNKLYPWESTFYVTETPYKEPTDTPVPPEVPTETATPEVTATPEQ